MTVHLPPGIERIVNNAVCSGQYGSAEDVLSEAVTLWQARLVEIGDMRPGSLVERFRKCGKPACHCAERGAPGHGPCYSLTHGVVGKTVTRVIPKGVAVEHTRQQIAEYHRFRDLVRELITVSEQICDAHLPSASAGGPSPVKKNFARRPAGHRPRARD